LGVACGQAPGLASAAEAVPEILVTARRLAPSVNEPAYSTTTLGREELDLAAGSRLDDVLRAVPGFGLFRRQSSRAAHPTTQGVSLRGLGPSGAGRTLVLLDGIPQNDAFGGWIDWSRLPTAGVGQASLTRGAGAGPWGNQALAGVIRLDSRAVENFGEFSAGPRDMFDATLGVRLGAGHLLAHAHRTDGSFLIRKDQRGVVDRRAADEGGVIEAGGRIALSGDTILRATARYSESKFINGLDIAVSKARVADAALSLLHEGDGVSWEVNAYARDQAFSAVFAAVNAARTGAAPSLDQFAVPATALGANAVLRHTLVAALSLDAGLDIRHAEGDTNENFQNLGAGFTRRREAGGEQAVIGGFAELNWRPTAQFLATVGGRVDAYRQSNGRRRETVLATAVIARDDGFASRDGEVGTARAALRYGLSEQLTLRAAGYTGFRLPTLNELYRPFRVGNDITEANPGLDVERLGGLDFGLDATLAPGVTLTATYFHARLKDAVTNITIRATPGLDPLLGVVVPAGGVLRQRQNLERITASGLEADLTAELTDEWSAAVRYLYASPKVSRSPRQPSLQGLRLAQVPRHQGGAQLTWTGERVSLSAALRGTTKQFDDDQNTRVLKGYVTADLSAQAELTESITLTAALENVFDRTIESARSADGLVSVGTPRTLRIGLRAGF
jgi:outer membrane receptor protein involved in Fe transport